MAVVVPKIYQGFSPLRLFVGRRVLDINYKLLLQDGNYLYATSGARCPLVSREVAYETASATNTQVDSGAAGIDLDRYQGCLRCTRRLDLGADSYRITARALVRDLEVTLRVYDVLSDTGLGTIVCDGRGSTTWEIAEGSLDLSSSEAQVSGEPRVLLVSIVGARFGTKSGATEGGLYAVEAFETIATAAQMP